MQEYSIISRFETGNGKIQAGRGVFRLPHAPENRKRPLRSRSWVRLVSVFFRAGICTALALAVWLAFSPAITAQQAKSQPPAGDGADELLKKERKDEYIIEHTFTMPKGPVIDALFSPNQKYAVTIGATRAIRLHEVESGRI
ncbi:MAG: hypothetical protein OEZ59_09450, partial [Deltaproteobacteria bacterium]|nr:hypothetical protein [Deltaproteobacteria bacterium]